MLHGMHAHLVQYRFRLPAEHRDDLDVLLGVEIAHQHALAEHLVQKSVLRPPADAVFANGRLFVGQHQQRVVGRNKQRHRLLLGCQAGEVGEEREDGILEDLCQARVVQRFVWELGEEVGQEEQAGDVGGRVVDQGEENGDEERPVFGDELGLGRCGSELVCFVIGHEIPGYPCGSNLNNGSSQCLHLLREPPISWPGWLGGR